MSTSSTTSAANAELREVIEEEIRHEEEDVAEDFPDIAVVKEEEAPEGFLVVEEYNNALFHLVRDPKMEDPETTEPSVRVTVNINDREMEFAQDENGEENEEMEVVGAVPFKVYICPQVHREVSMLG